MVLFLPGAPASASAAAVVAVQSRNVGVGVSDCHGVSDRLSTAHNVLYYAAQPVSACMILFIRSLAVQRRIPSFV